MKLRTINLYTKGQVKKLKDYLKEKYDIDLHSSIVTVDYDIVKDGGCVEVFPKNKFRIWTYVVFGSTVIKLNYDPDPEVLIGAGIIPAEEYRESLL